MKLKINSNVPQADPYVIAHNGTYFMYVTGEDGVGVFTSKDFINWDYFGICYQNEGQKSYWAPSVIEIDNMFYMYVSSMPIGESDTHLQRIQVAISDSPCGPFKFHNYLLPAFSIDAHVVKSGKDLYIFYSENNYEAKRAGTYIYLRKLITPYEASKNKKCVVRPTLDEEIYLRDRFKKGQHWHTIEGPFYLRSGEYHYLMYSGACYGNDTYFIGYSVAKGDTDDLLSLDFRKYPSDDIYEPLITKDKYEEGTGHNSVLKIKDKHYVIYHGRDYNDERDIVDLRTARICELIINNGTLNISHR